MASVVAVNEKNNKNKSKPKVNSGTVIVEKSLQSQNTKSAQQRAVCNPKFSI